MSASAGLVCYDRDNGSLHVMGYPAAAPATPALLLQLDRLYGWDVVRFDETQRRYLLDAHLVIGWNDGSDTFFAIAGAGQSGEVMKVRGNVVVLPAHIPGQNAPLPPSITPSGRNRLTLGAPGSADSGGMLLIESSTNAPRTLYVGFVPPDAQGQTLSGPGAELHAYHSVIAAAVSGKAGAMSAASGRRSGGAPGVRLGAAPVLVNSRISGADGYILSSLDRNARVEGTIFEDSLTGVYNCWTVHPIAGCVFRGMDAAVRDGGSIVLTMADCVFENNVHNWVLTHSDRGLTLVDCRWNAPAQGDVFQAWDNPRTGKRQYPFLISQRHVVVAAADQDGRPLDGVLVSVENEQGELAAAAPPRLRTGADGRTPGKGVHGALLLTEFVRRTTDTAGRPETTDYTYKITVSADGYAPASVAGYLPGKSWDVVQIELNQTDANLPGRK